MLTLYHHTSNSAAAAIMRDRAMRSAAPIDMPFAFFSTHRTGKVTIDFASVEDLHRITDAMGLKKHQD